MSARTMEVIWPHLQPTMKMTLLLIKQCRKEVSFWYFYLAVLKQNDIKALLI